MTHDDEPAFLTCHQNEGAAVRLLTPDEIAELRRDMAESSALARAELYRRRKERK